MVIQDSKLKTMPSNTVKGQNSPRDSDTSEGLEDIEIALLLEGVYRHYGYDFREYALTSVKRRVLQFARREEVQTISALQNKVLHDPGCMARFMLALSINVTSMFRDPGFYLAFRAKVVPLLRTYPFIRIWNAGCSTGEEAYSIAILLREEGLYSRSQIYATDMNKEAIDTAEAGVFRLSSMSEYADNYRQAGGRASFASYFASGQDKAVIDPSLKENITFAQHNLVADAPFNEFNVVLCRNVLIYFNRPLGDRVHSLLYSSLAMFGVLGLGKRETIRLTSHQDCYRELDNPARLYQKIK